jgi:hypothetical protein
LSLRNRHHALQLLKLAITGGAVALLLSTDTLQLSQLKVAPGGWLWITFAGLLVLAQMILLQLRFWWLLRAGGVALAPGQVIRIGLISWFLNASLLGGMGFLSGDAVRGTYLMRESSRHSAIVVALVVDRIVGLTALMMLAGVSFFLGIRAGLRASEFGMIPALMYLAAFVAAISIALLVLARSLGRMVAGGAAIALCAVTVALTIASPPILEGRLGAVLAVLALAAALPSLIDTPATAAAVGRWPRVGGLILNVLSATSAYRDSLAALALAYVGALIGHGLSIVALFALANGIAVEPVPTLGQTLFAAPIAVLTASVPLPANGLGVGEIAFDSMLRLLRAPGDEILGGGAAIYLSYRALNMVLALVGLPFFLKSRRVEARAREA